MPERIDFSTGDYITYSYSAAGQKLKTCIVKQGSTTYTDRYYGGSVYRSMGTAALAATDLFYKSNAYGRLTFVGGVALQEYSLKEHLGNTRATFTAENGQAKLTQSTDFYPFGQAFAAPDADANPFLYNGKELQTDLGLGWYDYGARFYDPTIGRWSVIDPLAENYSSWSTYNYCMNNPMNFIDPDGMRSSPIFDKQGNFLGTDNQGFSGDILIFDDKSKFKQNMDHSKAKEIGTVFNGMSKDLTLESRTKIIYKTLENTEFPDGSLIKSSIFEITLNKDPEAMARTSFDAVKQKHIINLDFSGQAWTVDNIRMVGGVHELYGHGLKNWGDRFGGGGSHRKCFEAEMDSKYWNGSTKKMKISTVESYWNFYYYEVMLPTGIQKVPDKYSSKFYKYYGK